MNAEQILAEIREANLSYLMLAQSLIRSDRDQALFRLGVNEDTAKLIDKLTPAQLMKMSSVHGVLQQWGWRWGVGQRGQFRVSGRHKVKRTVDSRTGPVDQPISVAGVPLFPWRVSAHFLLALQGFCRGPRNKLSSLSFGRR